MSMPPYCLMVPSISASTSGLREMLQGMTVASPPFFLMPAATSSHASALRLDTTTFAPSAAQCSAIERPMPRLEPVTMATLFSSPNGDGMRFLHVYCGSIGACRTAADKSPLSSHQERITIHSVRHDFPITLGSRRKNQRETIDAFMDCGRL